MNNSRKSSYTNCHAYPGSVLIKDDTTLSTFDSYDVFCFLDNPSIDLSEIKNIIGTLQYDWEKLTGVWISSVAYNENKRKDLLNSVRISLNKNMLLQAEDGLVKPYCSMKGITREYNLFSSLVEKYFSKSGLIKYEVDFLIDPDSGENKVVFELCVSGDIEEILDTEDIFYKELRKLISVNSRQHFSLTYSVL